MRSIGQSCAVSGTLYFFFALLIQRFPSANASLPYFAVISAFLFLNHFPFLLKSIKIAVMNISLIFTNRNAITAITFFCYSVSVKLSLLSVYFSITAILFCRKFQTGHAINSPISLVCDADTRSIREVPLQGRTKHIKSLLPVLCYLSLHIQIHIPDSRIKHRNIHKIKQIQKSTPAPFSLSLSLCTSPSCIFKFSVANFSLYFNSEYLAKLLLC